jgi:SAM-dependent methyltransferase
MAQGLSPTERFLNDFHDANAGLTGQAFGALAVVRHGRHFASSYDCLADGVTAGNPALSVLDLACGDGFFLSMLAQRLGGAAKLVGVDMSEQEIRAAQLRLGPGVGLCRAMAQALPLPTASVDVAVCHLALMLMDRVDLVVAELRRVLKAGGMLSAIVGARPPPSEAFDVYVDLLSRFPRRAPLQAVRFGDPRMRNPQGIEALLAPGFRGMRVDDITVERRCTPHELWRWWLSMYDLHLLDTADREAMQRQWLAAVAPACGPDGKLDHRERLRQITATAA